MIHVFLAIDYSTSSEFVLPFLSPHNYNWAISKDDLKKLTSSNSFDLFLPTTIHIMGTNYYLWHSQNVRGSPEDQIKRLKNSTCNMKKNILAIHTFWCFKKGHFLENHEK